MSLIILRTADNSNTLFNEAIGEAYHSQNGALAESMHVFISNGLLEKLKEKKELKILEVGFGTGLNAILTLKEMMNTPGAQIFYHCLETIPLPMEIIDGLGYEELIPVEMLPLFKAMHEADWNAPVNITGNFTLQKDEARLEGFEPSQGFDLVYFDAFAPDKQPELWTAEIFSKLFMSLNEGGILVTYSAKGDVKRALRESGFMVSRLPGPPGKRHMLRAVKPVL